MALQDPVAVYNAANNLVAHMVRNALRHSGIEAYVTEDISQVGTWAFGLIPELHKPQVWVDRSDIEKTKPVLDNYERRAAELRAADTHDQPDIEVECEECGNTCTFPATQRGSVQDCPHCAAYVDVGIEEDWEEEAEGQDDEDSQEDS